MAVTVRTVELISAGAKYRCVAEGHGGNARVIHEFFPAHEGPEPGLLTQFTQDWRDALKMAIALGAPGENSIAGNIHNGVDVVPGYGYAPVMLNLSSAGEFGGRVRLILTEDDARGIAETIIRAIEISGNRGRL
jgi:hypothetical protein